MRALVTGATGMVGGWLAQALVLAGNEVVCLVRDHVPSSLLEREGLATRVAIVRGDLLDRGIVARALNEYEIDTVFHLGAQAIVTVANRDPISTFESNIQGSWNVLEACRRHALLRRLVFASSDKCYGEAPLPYTEETPLRGSNPYDASKAAADLVAQSYLSTYRMPVAIARCGNIYGGGDQNWDRIVPGTIRSVMRGERPVLRSDGTMLRDYLYVEDAVSAYLALGRSEENGPFNFGTENPTSVLDVVGRILKIAGSPLEPLILGTARNEIKSQWLSSRRARELIGWAPAHSLDDGLLRTYQWYIRNKP